ncbi:acetyltransferase [Penicillium macrosclerotiorum]|uniref:acetyltransferase n=1 Tax=Penicillium macrosclerotiorum TaxID=303699 RepID=UPI0025495A66|nr:acetyltransferase [Penicillium macrosclerotiorum]KAJ5678819.1 acetyltransferase [Penicillium macrosclerotiorum]
MSPSTSLQLEPLTQVDSLALTDLWFAAFTDPDLARVFPNTPGVRQWLEDANYHDITHKPFQKYIKIVDMNTMDEHGQPRIAAYAKWDLSMPEERGRRYPPWHPEMPAELCEAFFQKEEANRKRVMGDLEHFCTSPPFPVAQYQCFLARLLKELDPDLDTVATHPDYQRRGCGSMLVQWGV